jgi:hypothetical protein
MQLLHDGGNTCPWKVRAPFIQVRDEEMMRFERKDVLNNKNSRMENIIDTSGNNTVVAMSS